MRAKITAIVAVLAAASLAATDAEAHCDTLDGPVVTDARAALADGDVTPVLKWVHAEDEQEIRTAFDRTMAVRDDSDAARELADTWFFETLVRIHRESEGAPYTGLAPAGSVEPGITAADRAIESGSADRLITALEAHLRDGVRQRYERVVEAQEHAGHGVAAGRAYVAAYVDFIHYVEGLHEALSASHHGAEQAAAGPHAH